MLFAAGGEESEQLQELFAAGIKQTAAIEATHVYFCGQGLKPQHLVVYFFLILFPTYCCVYTKTAAND